MTVVLRGDQEHSLENMDQGPHGVQAFLDYLNQRLAKRQSELEQAVKFSSHYILLETAVAELKNIRTKFLSYMRREGLL